MNSELIKESSTVLVRPARGIAGTVRLPGDKSISHRYAMLGGIAGGTTTLENYSTGADCASTLRCMSALGAAFERDGNRVLIQGCGRQLKAPAAPLDCGNSGSTIRMLSGILAGQEFTSELFGDESLSRRPMARIMRPLAAMGARITAQEGDRPPLKIEGGKLNAIQYEMPVPSAQVKSCVLFAGLFAEGETSVRESVRTRDHSEIALRAFGAEVRQDGNEAKIRGGQTLQGISAVVPGDISSAAFFLCAAALFPGSRIVVENLLLNPTRARLLDVLIGIGLRISVVEMEEKNGELVGTIQAEGQWLKGATLEGATSAALIDEIPVLAAIAPFTEDGMDIRDARELRVKESDRIAAVAKNLRAMGAEVEEREDGLKIPGRQILHGAEIDSLGDHRIAMAFAIAALRTKDETNIQGAESAAISFPEFFARLEGLAER